ncbi:SNF2 family helicase ATPase [Aspergillus sp. HF37]|nr:SNF2 family helicase ATPase [Aspergillus sp. HF37]
MANLSPDQVWYMGPDSISPSELFYPLGADEDDESFVLASSRFPTAQSRFVNKSLNHFYKQQLINLSDQNEKNKWALFPYESTKELRSSSRYFTLYTSRNGEIFVSQEKLENWPQLDKLQAARSEASGPDPYSHLLQKYPAEKDDQDAGAYPVYGDSGSEGECDDETWQEIQDEQAEQVPERAPTLASAEIDSVIASSISRYESKWHQDVLPKKTSKARHFWRMARKGKCTNQKICAFTHDIGLLEDRLKKLGDAIKAECLSTRGSKSELETLCGSMEPTVFDIQEQKWRVSVLEQEICPPKVDVAPKPRPVPKPRNDEDEESLYSESEGFIVDDSSDGSQPDFLDGPEFVDERGRPDRTPNMSSALSLDDVVIPSATRQRLRNQTRSSVLAQSEEPPLPAVPESGKAVNDPIDLTQDSPAQSPAHLSASDDLRIETPPLNPVEPKISLSRDVSCESESSRSVSPMPESKPSVAVEIRNSKPLQDASETNPSDDSTSMSLEVIEERQDRAKLLAKLVSHIPVDERERLTQSIPCYGVHHLQGLVKKALKAMRNKSLNVSGLGEVENMIIMRTASLFVSWENCRHHGLDGIEKGQIVSAQRGITGFPAFFNALCWRLNAHKQRAQGNSKPASTRGPAATRGRSLQQEANTPHKTRKRGVKENQDARRHQENARQRVALQDEQRKALEERMARIGVSNDDPTRQAVSFGAPEICLDPHIGQRVKPHQLKGVQFMWRELIEDEKQQGCLLAHTMGLGKTMQVISLLVTICAAASSDDERVRQQVPEALRRRSQTLVICPSSLIDNWYEEFLMWTPREVDIGPLRKVTSTKNLEDRLQEAFDWDEEGGVLIISYNIFQALVNNNETRARRKRLEGDQHRMIKECLLHGPNIIVADEAHKMKNPSSWTATAARQFLSKSRIALTGSPLANNLVDYFTMVDWIAPGYLGEFVDFKANYEEPIKEGLYADSTPYERRKSLVKLQVLKQILDPKINRAGISALEGDLPPKVEFVITVPLTVFQKKAYDAFVESVLQGKGDAVNTKLWSWLAILGLCCNHPTCFRDKLQSRADDAAKAATVHGEAMPGDESIDQADLPERVIAKEEEIFATVPDMNALDLSYRAQILDKIVTLSVKAGDKILIFSHSIPTLNYIEHVLQTAGHKYCRLDGQTPMHSRQAATKKFNGGSEHLVYLISTRAGGLGLNIAGANRVVIFDFKFSPMWEEQAVGRAYRLGQRKPVFVYRFIAGGTFEEVMYNKAIFKAQLAFRVVDKKNPVRWASRSLGEYLFPAKQVKQTDVSEYVGKDPGVLDQIIQDDQSSIRKIALTETFQKEGNDKLTDDDQKDVQQQLSDERLKRSDPAAYERLMLARRPLVQPNRTSVPGSGPGFSCPPELTPQYNAFSLPATAHNVGPRPLAPDFGVLKLNSVQAVPPAPFPQTTLNPASQMPDENSRPPQPQPPVRMGPLQPNPSAETSDHQPRPEDPIQEKTNNAPPEPIEIGQPIPPVESRPDDFTTTPTTTSPN